MLVQAGAGGEARLDDALYIGAGAEILPDADAVWAAADILIKVNPPEELPDGAHEADKARAGQLLI